MKVIDVMASEVITVEPDTSLKDAARRMVDGRISGLPVVDPENHLIGIITEGDFLDLELALESDGGARLANWFGHKQAEVDASVVGDLMTTEVVTINRNSEHSTAARLMERHGVKRLPVVDSDGTVVGIISRADIMSVFSRPDDVIEDEILEDVVRRVLWLDPEAVGIAVTDGVVTLTGELPTRTDVRLLEELTRRVDGVTAVENDLTFEFDDSKAKLDMSTGMPPRPNW